MRIIDLFKRRRERKIKKTKLTSSSSSPLNGANTTSDHSSANPQVDDPSRVEQTCKVCGRLMGDGEWIKYHMCTDCWKDRLTWLRTFTAEYHERMQQCLSAHGVIVSDPSIEGLDERGVSFSVPILKIPNCIPLRRDTKGLYGGDECGIYTVKVRGALLTIPDNGISIRYITRGSEPAFVENAFKIFHNGVLALATDGQELYGLTNDGLIRSTAGGWENLRLFDKQEEIQRIADSVFPSGTKENLVSEIINGKRWEYSSGSRRYYYDRDQKAFIMSYESGCSHEGIDMNFTECDREELLYVMLKWKRIREFVDEIHSGKYPSVLIAADLPQHEPGVKIKVPSSYSLF